MGYGISKGAMQRIAGFLAVELSTTAYGASTCSRASWRPSASPRTWRSSASTTSGAPPEVIGAVVAWLTTDPEAAELNGEHRGAVLLPRAQPAARLGRPNPRRTSNIAYDHSGAIIDDLETKLAAG